MGGKSGPPKLIDMESRVTAAYTAPAQTEKKESPVELKESPVEKKESPVEKKDDGPARSVSLPSPAPASTIEYAKDAPLKSTIEVPETTDHPTDFEPRNLEIKQDDPESDDEELTEAKKRAPVDDDDFEDEAGPSVVDVGGKEDKKTEDKEVKAQSPAVSAVESSTPAAGEKTPITTQNPANVSRMRQKLRPAPLIPLNATGQAHHGAPWQIGRGRTSAPVGQARKQQPQVSVDQGQELGQAVGRVVEGGRSFIVFQVFAFVSCSVVDCVRGCFTLRMALLSIVIGCGGRRRGYTGPVKAPLGCGRRFAVPRQILSAAVVSVCRWRDLQKSWTNPFMTGHPHVKWD